MTTFYKKWHYREMENTDWYLKAFSALGEAAHVYAEHGYEERHV